MRRTKGIRGYGAIALTSVVAKWCSSVFVLLQEKIQEPIGWSSLHVDWEWPEDRNWMPIQGVHRYSTIGDAGSIIQVFPVY